jgi:hypothetical protein
MARLPLGDALILLSTLEQVQRAAARRTGTAGQPPLALSPPMEELRCLMVEAHRIDDVETHLWTVGALALRDVLTRVYMRTWNIGPRSFPHDFGRLLERDVRGQVGDPYPYLIADDVEWSEDLAHLPREIWLTHREMRSSQGSIETRARQIVAARYPVTVVRWSLRTVPGIGGHEE